MRFQSYYLTGSCVSLAVHGYSFSRHHARLAADIQSHLSQLDMTPPEPMGDLVDGATSITGRIVLDCLEDPLMCQEPHTVSRSYTPPGALGTAACTADKCCAYQHMANELKPVFVDSSKKCTQTARAAIRLQFHDAAGWAKGMTDGGADGSIILNDAEIKFPQSIGLDEGRNFAIKTYAKYKQYGVGAADMIQFMGNLGTVSCPLGPRVRTFVGRKDNAKVPPETTIPNHLHEAAPVIKTFTDKGLSGTDLAALIGAHTAANQFATEEATSGQPFDSTPGVWDNNFYANTVQNKKVAGVFKLESDTRLAGHNATKGAMGVFSSAFAQNAWNVVYSQAMVKVSLFGVAKVNDLTDCTKVLPNRVLTAPR